MGYSHPALSFGSYVRLTFQDAKVIIVHQSVAKVLLNREEGIILHPVIQEPTERRLAPQKLCRKTSSQQRQHATDKLGAYENERRSRRCVSRQSQSRSRAAHPERWVTELRLFEPGEFDRLGNNTGETFGASLNLIE